MATELASFGVVIPPVKGAKEAAQDIRAIGTAGEQTAAKHEASMKKLATGAQAVGTHHKATATAVRGTGAALDANAATIARSVGGYERLAGSLARNAGGAQVMLRALGPLGGGAMLMASQMQRAALSAEQMTFRASQSVNTQRLLEQAFSAGKIAAATMEAAQLRLNAARQAAVAIEQSLAAAMAKTAAAREGKAITGQLVQQQQLVVGGMPGNTSAAFREQDILNRLKRDAITDTATLSAALQNEKAIKAMLAAANQEAAAAQRLLNDANKASIAGMGATVGVIVGLIAVLVGLGVAIYGVHKAWTFLTDSLAAAGKVQSSQTSLRLMIGNAIEAKKVFEELNQLELDTGIFDEASLNLAATKLYGIGFGLDDLVPKVKELANVAAILNLPIEASVQSYVRLVEMIGATGKVQARTLTQFAQQGFDILLTLRQATGKSEKEVLRMVKDGEIGLKQIDAALKELGKNDFMGARARDWEGLWKRLKAGWTELHEIFGKPIIERLSPVLEKVILLILNLRPQITAAGEWVAQLISKWEAAAKAGNIGALLEAQWKRAFDNIGAYLRANLAQWSRDIGKWVLSLPVFIVKAQLKWVKETVAEGLNAYTGAMARSRSGSGANQPYGPPAPYNPTMDKDEGWEIQNYYGSRRESILPSGGTGGAGDADKIKSDLKIINDYARERELIRAEQMTGQERSRRLEELQLATSKQLYDPGQFSQYLEAWQIMQREKELVAARTDARIASGQATMFEAMQRGIQKTMEAWGNMAQMAERAVGDIANSLVNNISSNLSDILSGTKSIGQGFKDMALGIVNDIQRIIVKLLVEWAIRQAMGYFMPGLTSTAPGRGYAEGGRVTGFAKGGYTGDKGGVVHPGEYVFDKSSTQNIGIENLAALHRGAPHFAVGSSRGNSFAQIGGRGGLTLPSGPGNDFGPGLWGNVSGGGGPWSGSYGPVDFDVEPGALNQNVAIPHGRTILPGGGGIIGGGFGIGGGGSYGIGYTPGMPVGSVNSRGAIFTGFMGGQPVFQAQSVSGSYGNFGGGMGGMGGLSGWIVGSGGRRRPALRQNADGGRIPGAYSTSDSIPAWLSTGEVVINSRAVAELDRVHGRGWEDRVNARRFASGGRNSGQPTSSGSGGQTVINAPVSISVTNNGGGQQGGEPSPEQVADLQRQMEGVADSWAEKNLRHGGRFAALSR